MTERTPKHLLFLPALCLVLFFCLPPPAVAQRYDIHTYQEWDGMPTNPVYDATQDSLGVMWFATRVGIVSYDGRQWDVQSIHPNAAPQTQQLLHMDGRGQLWTLTHWKPLRLSRMRDGQWQTFRYPDLDYQEFSLVGLEVQNLPDGSDRAMIVTIDGHILLFEDGHWQRHKLLTDTGGIRYCHWDGEYLYLGANNGLFRLDPTHEEAVQVPIPDLPAGPINFMAPAAQSSGFWLIGPDWIALWDGQQLVHNTQVEGLIQPNKSAKTHALADGAGGVIFSLTSGVQYFHPATGLEDLSIQNGLLANGATGFFRDREGNIWITGHRGLSKLVSRRFAGYNHESGLLEDEVTAIHQMKNGQIVLAHPGGLTFMDSPPRTLPFKGRVRGACRTIDLEEDPQGNLWVATDRAGLARIDPKGQVKWYDVNNSSQRGVYALYFDPDQTLWIGTANGLFRMRDGNFEEVVVPQIPTFRSTFIRRITPDPGGGFYLATAHFGILHYRDGLFTVHQPRDSDDGLNVFNSLTTEDGRVWVGTSVGLFLLEDGDLVPSKAPLPEIDRPVYSLLEDRSGRIWFGTDVGIVRWDGQHQVRFTLRDGLLGNETNRDALIQDQVGHIWIGTDSGASKYSEIFDVPASGYPGLEITGFRVDGEILPVDQELHLAEPPLSLEILYRGVSFLDEKRLRYRSRLENFEDDWHDESTLGTGQLNYIQVPPGRYRFHVQAIRPDGVGSAVVTSPWVVIKPPFQDRWYVKAFLALAAIGMIWVVFALISGRRYAHNLEKEVYKQTWELRLREQSIKAESHRLAATLKNISDGVLAVSYNGKVVLANAAAEGILNLPANLIIGRQIEEVLPLDADHLNEDLLQMPHPGHPDRILEVSTSAVVGDEAGGESDNEGRVVAFRDITHRLNQERAQIRTQKLESLGVFAGGLAHDFNNLLTVMLGNISVLDSSPSLPEGEKQMVDLIHEATVRAQNLTRQLLTFARGGDPLLETACVGQIVRKVVDFSLSGTTVSCELDLADNLWPVQVDPGQIDQVLANLIINAVQAMPRGGVLRVKACNVGSNQRKMVMVEIADEGVGIKPEDLPRIFDPYFTTKNVGSGLGLAIAFSIVTRHGGHLTVDSQLGQGAVFRVFLKAD